MSGCKTCNEPNHSHNSEGCTGGCGNIPPALEVQGEDVQVLFGTYVVPAQCGDESKVPMENGKYHNLLVRFETNGHLYLYDSFGIPTRLDNRD